MTERTTVRLPGGLLTLAKRKAAAEGRTLTSLIEEGLRSVIADKPGAKAAGRRLPRVSSARGGFAPGIKDLRDVQELEDLEYIERLKRL